jgi:hypothetical protein
LSFSSGGGNDAVRLMSGSYTFAADLSPALHNVAVTVDAGASATFTATQHLANLVINGNASLAPGGNIVMNTSALAVTGRLDLADNNLILDYAGASPLVSVTNLIATGRNGGSWTGNGIITSAANGNLTTLGVAEASQVLDLAANQTALFAGETVDATAVLVKYTYGGDANLDGKLNVDDYGRIDSSIGLVASGWFNGDFNYDGKIDVDDYGVIDSNIGLV